MNLQETQDCYSRPDIQKEMLRIAKDREVAGAFRDGSYFRRPDIMAYPKDILERVRRGMLAFHCSVGRWTNPMQLSPEMKPADIEGIRKGFDLIIDIDAKDSLDHSKIAADAIIEFPSDLGVHPTVKFSGNRGFHIAIASEAFPRYVDLHYATASDRQHESMEPIYKLYPQIPRLINSFIYEKLRDVIMDRLVEYAGGFSKLYGSMPPRSELTPDSFVRIDWSEYEEKRWLGNEQSNKSAYSSDDIAVVERGWGNRHLFRMPYSLHVKQWLASVPIDPYKILSFSIEDARPENVKTNQGFMISKEGEATELLLQALNWTGAKREKPEEKRTITRTRSEAPIPESYFPPSIVKILNGLKDGKKRSLFTLLTFLSSVNWGEEEIEKRIEEWNKRNDPPLKEQFVKTQIKWHFRQSRELMPANYDSDQYYKSVGVTPTLEEIKHKNPVNAAYQSMRAPMKRNKNPR